MMSPVAISTSGAVPCADSVTPAGIAIDAPAIAHARSLSGASGAHGASRPDVSAVAVTTVVAPAGGDARHTCSVTPSASKHAAAPSPVCALPSGAALGAKLHPTTATSTLARIRPIIGK